MEYGPRNELEEKVSKASYNSNNMHDHLQISASKIERIDVSTTFYFDGHIDREAVAGVFWSLTLLPKLNPITSTVDQNKLC